MQEVFITLVHLLGANGAVPFQFSLPDTKANCAQALQDFMEKTNANENSFEGWQGNLPTLLSGLDANQQAITLQSLKNVLTETQGNPMADFHVLQPDLGNSLLIDSLKRFLSDILPSLWGSTAESFTGMLLVQQPYFVQRFGDAVQFLPNSEEMPLPFLNQCVAHIPPTLQLQTLECMASLLLKGVEFRQLKEQFAMDQLKSKTLTFLWWHQTNPIPEGEYPLNTLIHDLESAMPLLESLVETFAKATIPDNLKDSVKRFLTQNVADCFIQRGSAMFKMVKASEQAIPSDYQTMMQQKNVSQLKVTLFSKKTHTATCSNLELYVQATDLLDKSVKLMGHFLSGTQLGVLKSNDSSLKSLRIYSISVHAANLLLHKLPGAAPRERAAKLRELLGIGH